MKIFFIAVLVLNFLFEGVAGLALVVLSDTGIGAAAHDAAGNWGMNYGFAAWAIASVIFWVWPHRENSAVVGTVLGILITFHLFLTISLGVTGNQMGPTILHGIMFLLSVVAYSQRSKWCTS